MVLLAATSQKDCKITGNYPISSEDTETESRLQFNRIVGLVILVISTLLYFFKLKIFVIGMIIGLILWVYYTLKRHSFFQNNKKALKDNLMEYPVYLELLDKHPD